MTQIRFRIVQLPLNRSQRKSAASIDPGAVEMPVSLSAGFRISAGTSAATQLPSAFIRVNPRLNCFCIASIGTALPMNLSPDLQR
jgi:hypothetical protein